MTRQLDIGVQADVALALRLADHAAEIARPMFEAGVTAQTKSDGTPVTSADLAVERALLAALTAERPADAVLSEEAGAVGRSRRRWLLDPVDGTENFVAGHPSWGTHLALEVDGVVVLGVMTRPVLGLRWWAATGFGAHRGAEGGSPDGTLVHVSDVAALSASRVSVWSDTPAPALTEGLRSVAHVIEPTYEDYIDVIEGRLEAVVFPHPGVAFVWDHAPAVVLVTEAGGRFRDPTGGSRIDVGSGVFTNGLIDGELGAVIDGHLTIGDGSPQR